MTERPRRVWIAARDLVFRSKLQALVRALGAELTPDDRAADIAVIELGGPDSEVRIRDLTARNLPVLAFGPHVQAEALRAARALGARAVPNSEVERSLRALLSA